MFRGRILYHLILLLTVVSALALTASTASAIGPNGISRPIEGDTVYGEVSVVATADDPNFLAWQLDLLPVQPDKPGYFLARGDTARPEPGALHKMSTDTFPNGLYHLRLRVIRTDGNYTEYFTTFTIDQQADRQAGHVPTAKMNGVTDPPNGGKVMCLAELKGYADNPNFLKWQLDLLQNGLEDKTVFLDRGFAPHILDEGFTRFDTTQFPDGEHVVRLRVVKKDGNFDTYTSKIIIDNSLIAGPVSRRTCGCADPSTVTVAQGPNGISNPPNGTTVSKTTPVCGIADDPTFSTWQLDLLFQGDDQQSVMIASGNTPNRTRAPFIMLDTTPLNDGLYGLRLSVSRPDMTYSVYKTFICVANKVAAGGSRPAACNALPKSP